MQEGLLLTEPTANGLESRASRRVTLFSALWAFFHEHQYCGDLNGGVEDDRMLDNVHVRRVDQPGRESGLIGSSAALVRVPAFG